MTFASQSTFQYIETDIPAGMTILEYRRSRPPVRRSFVMRLLRSRRGGG